VVYNCFVELRGSVSVVVRRERGGTSIGSLLKAVLSDSLGWWGGYCDIVAIVLVSDVVVVYFVHLEKRNGKIYPTHSLQQSHRTHHGHAVTRPTDPK
jgi:hypothetical protein